MKFKVVFIALCLLSIVSNAQTKVGTVDSEFIVSLMPETKKAMELLSTYAKRLDTAYQAKLKEYGDKVTAFNKLKDNKDYSDNYKQLKVNEITELETGLQKSKNNGTQLVQLKRNEVMRPVYKKLSGVISEVAKAEGYNQILTTSGNEFAYIDEKFDLTQKILDKLGIKIPEQKK